MGQVSANSSILIAAKPVQVSAALADYVAIRPKILSDRYLDYQVVKGGQGEGTVARWKLQATKSRVRDIEAHVSVSGDVLTEKDAHSTLVTTWTVREAAGGSEVTTMTQWKGAGGVSGFFEKTFAPLGLKKIQTQVLENLKGLLESQG
ncbi:MAG: SRPBCC family protein [Mycobacteriaceae bacterium]